jgi:hypothetical protein
MEKLSICAAIVPGFAGTGLAQYLIRSGITSCEELAPILGISPHLVYNRPLRQHAFSPNLRALASSRVRSPDRARVAWLWSMRGAFSPDVCNGWKHGGDERRLGA